ncbi:hypothetical protein H310_00188 [Aphanomyces invadans]|uniref:Uncharacterized protein n=1 Tax=Aphanomyces invadans TaxID=157072 RepID=A0A024UVI2_9STRA|nr:hypothetical protein H310_00188 [Aphanomyces invadans]ETW09673.1 hypothetical protein H310_00188 [Aphanomyces invadans]|eukprot:XP_008861084.1 hypothetical protein H310_00188 [Aphanomyces invadans]
MASSETDSSIGASDGGVVLTATALRHLEVEKAHLRFKLADAEKQSELRHGQVAAYESKIQDLLLLVEMNKKVAAEALRCSTTTAQRLDEANEQLERWQHRGIASLARRRRHRHLSQILATLKSHAVRVRTWCLLLIRRRQLTLRLAFVRWTTSSLVVTSSSAAQQTQSLSQPTVPLQPPPLVVHSLDALRHRLEKQMLALAKPHATSLRRNIFSSWKGTLSTSHDQKHTAQVWYTRNLRYLLRRVWTTWSNHIATRASSRRSTRWRLLRSQWQRWVKYKWVQVRRRYLLGKVMDAKRRRRLAQGLVVWQLHSKNYQIHTWLACLEDAKTALAEERSTCAKQKADVDAYLELQTSAEQERHRAIGNHIDLCLRFMRWGGYVRLQHRVNLLATQHASKRTAQVVRKLFFRWRSLRHTRQMARQCIRHLRGQHTRRFAHQVLFQWWRLCRRTKLLQRSITKRLRALLATGMSMLVAASVRRHKEQELHLQLKYSHIHSDLDLKLEQSRRHCQASHAAHYMAYIRRRHYLRRVVTQWGRCLPRRRLLKRLLARVVERWQRRKHRAWTKWTAHSIQGKWELIWSRACTHRLHEAALSRPFAAWRRVTSNSARLKKRRFYMQSAFALWCVSVGRRRTQVQAANDIFHVLRRGQCRYRFAVWRRKIALQSRVALYRSNRHHQLLCRMFRAWRKFAWGQCHVAVAASNAGQARNIASHAKHLLRWAFRAWHLWLHHIQTRRAHAERSLRRGLLGWQWSHVQAFGVWKHKVCHRKQAQSALARILKRHKLGHKGLVVAWTRWTWSSRVLSVTHQFQQRLRHAHRDAKLAQVSRRTNTLVSTTWMRWRYQVAATRKIVHGSDAMMHRRQRQHVTWLFRTWTAYHLRRHEQIASLRQLGRRRCGRSLASALLRWRGHSHAQLGLQYDEAANAASKQVAAIMLHQQRAAWQRQLVQAWNRYTRNSIHIRQSLYRRLGYIAECQLRWGWKQWLAMQSPVRNARGLRLLQLHWDRRRLHQSFREWHHLSLEAWRRHDVLHRLLTKTQAKLTRRGFIRWLLAATAARQCVQRAKFAKYTGRQSEGLRQCLQLQWYWHRWYRYHLVRQDQRRQWSHRQGMARSYLLRRCMSTWTIFRIARNGRHGVLRALWKTMRRHYLALALSSWRRKAQRLSLHESTTKSECKFKRATRTVAHLIDLQAKHGLLGRCMFAWRSVTVPRHTRLAIAWSSWMDVMKRARFARHVRAIHTLATRFHCWNATVARRRHQRRVLRSFASRRYRRDILCGFYTWHHLVRRSMHDECLQRVVIIEDMVASQTLVLDTLHFLRPIVHRWRQAAVAAQSNRSALAMAQEEMVKLLWSHWATYSRRRRRVIHMQTSLRTRFVRHVMAAWSRWQRRWTAKQRMLRSCVVLSMRRQLSSSWTKWLRQHQRQMALTLHLSIANERQGLETKAAGVQRSARRYASLAILRSEVTSVALVWSAWTRLVRMRRWWWRKRRSRQLRRTWHAWEASMRVWKGCRLKDAMDRWHLRAVRCVQVRLTRDRCVTRWLHDRHAWLQRFVWQHWRSFLHGHSQWRQRQVCLGHHKAQRALLRHCMAAWRKTLVVEADDKASTRALLGLILTSWQHAAKGRASRRAKSRAQHDQMMLLCRYLEMHMSHLTPRLPAIFFAWKQVVFDSNSESRHGHLRHKWITIRSLRNLVCQWSEYTRYHHRRRASAVAHMTASRDRTRRMKAWHAWLIASRDKPNAVSSRHHLRHMWRLWVESTFPRGARACRDRERWSDFVRRVRSSTAKAVVFHTWRQFVVAPATLDEVHDVKSSPAYAGCGTWQPILRRAADIAISWQRRQVEHAWWRWFLHVNGLSFDLALTSTTASSTASAVAHWTLAQWNASVLHARRQQRWLMAFFTKTCHVQQLRRRFVRWKAALGAAAPHLQLRARAVSDMQFKRRVAKLRRYFVLRGFDRWKAWYIFEALADAEREHALLMDALQDIASYRMSLDM